jgi:hypothetical protein
MTPRSIALGLTLAALAAPAASASTQQDLRGADAKPQPVQRSQELRNADQRDNRPAATEPQRTYRNLVSADARDSRRVVIIPYTKTPAAEPGFDWTDAVIGAGVVAALIAIAGAAAATSRRRQSRLSVAH